MTNGPSRWTTRGRLLSLAAVAGMLVAVIVAASASMGGTPLSSSRSSDIRSAAAAATSAGIAAGTGTAAPSGAPVVLIVMENHEFSEVVGSSDAPFLNDTLIPGGRIFTHYTAVAHPSLPNYLAMTAGKTLGKIGTDEVSAGELRSDNLFHQLSKAGIDWRAYEESMPSRCYRSYSAGSAPAEYTLKHDPAMTFADIAHSSRCRQVVPLSSLDTHDLPAFSFVTPNECSDMHSCGVTAGDRWLSHHIPPLIHAGAVVIVTFDEGSSDEGGGGRVLLVEAGAGITPGDVDARRFNHYSLLAALEARFGVPRLGAASTAHRLPL